MPQEKPGPKQPQADLGLTQVGLKFSTVDIKNRIVMCIHPKAVFEPRHEKNNDVVSAQLRHKQSCTSTENDYGLEMLDLGGIILSM